MRIPRERWSRVVPVVVYLALFPRVGAAMQPCPEGTHPSRWGLVIAAAILLLGLALAGATWRASESVLTKLFALLLVFGFGFAAILFLGLWSAAGPCVP